MSHSLCILIDIVEKCFVMDCVQMFLLAGWYASRRRQSKRLGTRKRTRSQHQPDDVDDDNVSPTPTTGERNLEAEQEEWHDNDSGTERPNRRRQQRRQRQRQRQSSRQPRQPRRTSRQTGELMDRIICVCCSQANLNSVSVPFKYTRSLSGWMLLARI